jgi:hypothetical protein
VVRSIKVLGKSTIKISQQLSAAMASAHEALAQPSHRQHLATPVNRTDLDWMERINILISRSFASMATAGQAVRLSYRDLSRQRPMMAPLDSSVRIILTADGWYSKLKVAHRAGTAI